MDFNEYVMQHMVMEQLREARSRAAVRAMLAQRDLAPRAKARPGVRDATTCGRWSARLGRRWLAAACRARRALESMHGAMAWRSSRKGSAVVNR